MVVFHDYKEEEHAGKSVWHLALSDHLLLFAWIEMEPMTSLRVPKIDKTRLIKKYEAMDKRGLMKQRQNFFAEFSKIRTNHIRNGMA